MDKHKSMRRIIRTSDAIPDGRGGVFPPTYRYETTEELLGRTIREDEQKWNNKKAEEAITGELKNSNG